MTIDEAREQIFDENTFIKGSHCPCCDQFVKKYSRKLNSLRARSLISLFQQNTKIYPVHISKIAGANTGGEFALLRYWGLIKEARNDRSDKRTSGKWFITAKGCEFVKNNLQVPAYLFIYNNEPIGFSDEMTTIKEALTSKFDYRELMGDFYVPPIIKRIASEQVAML